MTTTQAQATRPVAGVGQQVLTITRVEKGEDDHGNKVFELAIRDSNGKDVPDDEVAQKFGAFEVVGVPVCPRKDAKLPEGYPRLGGVVMQITDTSVVLGMTCDDFTVPRKEFLKLYCLDI